MVFYKDVVRVDYRRPLSSFVSENGGQHSRQTNTATTGELTAIQPSMLEHLKIEE